MNIAQAKDYIKQSVEMYLKKDEFGDYRIPIVRQRPIFLLGAPGIGKSAIMEQIADELDIALVSYSMTHHTRQSALGLPFIKEKEYEGNTYDVSEYTMSEIIASVYETMEGSGVKEGILFLDEINCVSETLYPSMLQFLQFKVFGRHRVPDGWVIVTAGNPPEYNKSVREFDVVTLDRLKVLKVDEDYGVWKLYAKDKGIHSAITGYLDGDTDSFYHIETTAEGSMYVTARGWEDLSDIIYMYEESGLNVTEELISQYLRCDNIVREFAAYYDLYKKYRSMFNADDILSGMKEDSAVNAIKEAPIDERIALVGILLDSLKSSESVIMDMSDVLRKVRASVSNLISSENIYEDIHKLTDNIKKAMDSKEKAGTLTGVEKKDFKRMILFYEEMLDTDEPLCAESVTEYYKGKVAILKDMVADEKKRIHNGFSYICDVFSDNSNEMVIFVTELTVGKRTSAFLATYGSEDYDKYNELLMIGNKETELRREIEDLFGVK